MIPDGARPTRVMVTGASGRVGRRVVDVLGRTPDYDVVAVGGMSAATARTGMGVDLGDFRKVREMITAVRPDAIVHLGAVVGARCDEDPVSAERINVDGTGVLAEAFARHGGSRFVFASTAAVYGDVLTGAISESAECAPANAYGRQKLQAEQRLAETAVASSGTLTAVALRIFNVFGPGFPASLVERLRQSTAAHPVELRAMDEFVRDYVHVDDVVDAVALALSAELGTPATAVNIGSGIGLSSRQLVERLSRVSPVFYAAKQGRPSSSVADIGRARLLLGFEPRSSDVAK
jgi:UDP-glucose 4-epimerase